MKQQNRAFSIIIKLFLIFWILFSFPAFGQTGDKLKTGTSPLLDGKTFIMNVYSAAPEEKSSSITFLDELSFINGKISSRKLGAEYRYIPDTYSTSVDPKGTTSFIGFTKNENGDMDIFWNGSITGNTITGTMHWFSKGVTWTYSGKIKNEHQEK